MTKPELYPYGTARKYIKIAKDFAVSDHLMWGSDAPSTLTKESYQNLIDFVAKSDIFSSGELNDVFCNNACVVYPY